ncbi:MAG: ornithine cyclodeaminase family protein [Steroidobacteraceae bacterium]|jgi:ornithine cyclodeaminase
MIHIDEAQCARLISHELAFAAISRALIAAASPSSSIFPVVLGHASDPQNRFTLKSGTDADLAGVKIGSYFPTNDRLGLPRHDSIILLFDQSKGKIGAIVEAGKLNAYRTAAADAVATDILASKDASTVALFGTGHQAEYEALALSRIRTLKKILVVGRDPVRTASFAKHLQSKGLPAETSRAEQACAAADVIVTATAATAPLFHAEWVRAGTHISSMGSDATGKRELPPDLFHKARLFCDLPEQSRRIGEFQHAEAKAQLTAIGDVLSGKARGRVSADDVTIFDSSGIALQDLYIAQAIIKAHMECRT